MEEKPPGLVDFLLALWARGVSLLSGICSVIFWAVAAFAEPLPVSVRWWLIFLAFIALSYASFEVWKKERLEVMKLRTRRLQIVAQIDKGEPAVGGEPHYRVTVRNLSEALSVEECRVTLECTHPASPRLPLPLHCSQEVERSHTVTLHAREERKFDVFRIPRDGTGFEFTGAADCPRVPTNNYKLRITAKGKDVPTEEAFFEIVLAGGGPVLRPVASPEPTDS